MATPYVGMELFERNKIYYLVTVIMSRKNAKVVADYDISEL